MNLSLQRPFVIRRRHFDEISVIICVVKGVTDSEAAGSKLPRKVYKYVPIYKLY